ncbi:ABC transporter substrate-binding protein [Plastoroseomonas hellenica]|uniref:ABC transporter substrate-binding protein n=1 Tax=Plastoroseomonas hellenica TaxID=2687306 RepID=UPI001BA63216|nr:ABC transporter substrate-binding protein [Plastoroseomonas hellenica]MBR0642361.1 ABC transporter substrate-binding protein [Plastoroseomonas hellenica]
MSVIARIAAAAALLCSIGIAAVQAGPADNTLRWASDSEPANIIPYQNTVREGVVMGYLIWDAPTYRDPATGEYRMHLAESVRLVDDTTIELRMRDGITAHNGEVVDAQDVADTVNIMLDPANRIVNFQRVAWLSRAEVVDARTVRLIMKEPYGPWQEYLTNVVVMPSDYLKRVGLEGMAREPVGTGPYRVAELAPGRQTVLQRFDRYFGGAKGQPAIERLIFRRIPEGNTRIAELLTGGLDWIWRVLPDQARNLSTRRNLTIVSGETVRIVYMGMDAGGRTGRENNPMTDLRVRQAIAHAIDRAGIVRNLVGEGAQVLHTPCHPEQFGCTQEGITRYDYNPARARALLAEAGYPDGFEVSLMAYRERPWVEAVIGQLRAVGIRARLNWVQADTSSSEVRAGNVRLNMAAWGSTSLYDVAAITSYFFGGTPNDMARDPEVAALLRRGDSSTDPQVRLAAYAPAIRRITEQAYWLPMWTFPLTYAFNSQLEFRPSADEVPRFFEARWRR